MNRSLIFAKNFLNSYRAMTVQSKYSFSKTREEDWLDKRTKTNEKVYFNEEDKKAMKILLEKLNTNCKFVEDSEYLSGDSQAAEKILKRYNVQYTQALVDELVDWKLGRD